MKLFPSKLKSRWSRPFIITQALPSRVVKFHDPNKRTFKVNVHRVKPYIDGGFDEYKTIIELRDPSSVR